MPDGKILVVSVCEEHSWRVADNADGVRKWAFAVRIYPAPDARIVVVSWAAMHQTEFLAVHLKMQHVWQAVEKPEDVPALLRGSFVEELAIGSHASVHPPKIFGSKFIARSEGAQTHLLMIAEKHGHVRSIHDDSEEIHAQGTTVDHIP